MDANALLTKTLLNILTLAVLVLQDPTMDWVTMGYPQLAQALRDFHGSRTNMAPEAVGFSFGFKKAIDYR